MARPAGGHECVDAAITQAAQARTISELRMEQALLLPLKFGLSLDETGVALGLSKSWTLRLAGRNSPRPNRGYGTGHA
jgi:hypothetical protein